MILLRRRTRRPMLRARTSAERPPRGSLRLELFGPVFDRKAGHPSSATPCDAYSGFPRAMRRTSHHATRGVASFAQVLRVCLCGVTTPYN